MTVALHLRLGSCQREAFRISLAPTLAERRYKRNCIDGNADSGYLNPMDPPARTAVSSSRTPMKPRKTTLAVIAALVLTSTLAASGGATNLLPNGGFAGKDPLQGWLTAFPDEAFYKGNAPYVKIAPPAEVGGRKAVMLDLPPGIAGNQGGKLESVPVPVEPGGSYRIEVDCMTWDLSAKIFAEAWSSDPNPDQKRTIFRRAAADGRPALIMCFRAQVPSPPGNSKTWTTAGRDFTVPKTVRVAGKDQRPEFISVKVVNYGATMAAGKSYFANFRLIRVEPKIGDEKKPAKP